MILDDVISQFEAEHKGKYSKDDRELIVAAARSLGLVDFSIRYRNEVKTTDGTHYSVYFRDVADIMHVHPTMIVSRHEFEGFQVGTKSRYSRFPFMTRLSNWSSKDGTGRPVCPRCFLQIPLIGLCGTCGFDLEDLGDE